MEKFYYYTRWKFHRYAVPEGLDHPGPYHSTWITETPPNEFLENTQPDNLEEFYFRRFDNEQQMKDYAVLVGV